ncbi:mariner-Tc1 transposon family protein [Coccidioides posadasii C735 delta SOWgp]|uniref:Mariner-Tc1 transposon family protein n=1 Tax=Coccidioides posadasii (strain C735) TaxID=222929 RepID=C5PH67_COCP7|nr:mariner-Tc1 transposon family protein [Coccidioides posadasii C735 delta SOWgp]EER23870.1 mariner-Tc1 transposon family protein [Coccidioides posadasii C735 delta SOWgp]|eukprot:XP_003066015.1 mariner-Tc1 transposon family protein [Coccidioides posadasii C735 delta SOWgp]
MVNNEAIKLAIEDLELQETPNYSATAKKYSLSRETLRWRHQGLQVDCHEATSRHKKKLTNIQEDELLEYINKLCNHGLAPTPQILQNIVQEMTGEDMGINWVTWFCEHHKDKIKTVYLKPLDKNRQVADNYHCFQHFYSLLSEKISQYNITLENTYNFDEKGFLLGSCHALKHLVSIKALQAGKSVATQDGSWEFLSLLCSVSADGIALPPALIYQGESRDLQDMWLDDFDGSEYAYFAASVNGWSNDKYGLEWLQWIFNPHTKAKAGRARCLLLLDGHSSHINMKFIEYANRERILLLILPPHSTHHLQPLDVGVFGPLGKAYSSELESLLCCGLGYIQMTKRDFWRLFNAAWKKALTGDNICAGFAKTGIYPLDPQHQLS